jgi:hypothetical protein
MAVSVNYCQPLPKVDIDDFELDVAELCADVTSDIVGKGTKDCGNRGTTPVLNWVNFSAFSKNFGSVAFDIGFYIGVQTRTGATNCVWVGSESLGVCAKSCDLSSNGGNPEIAYDALKSLVDSLWSLVEDASQSLEEDAPDYVPDIVFEPEVLAVASIVVVAVVAYVLSNTSLGVGTTGVKELVERGIGSAIA